MSETEKTLPLDGWHRARGGRMVPFAGYQMPVQYEGIIAEHLWTRASAGLFDVSHMGQLLIAGPDAEKGLETQLPADLSSLGSFLAVILKIFWTCFTALTGYSLPSFLVSIG